MSLLGKPQAANELADTVNKTFVEIHVLKNFAEKVNLTVFKFHPTSHINCEKREQS